MKINFFIPMVLIIFAAENKTSLTIKNIKNYESLCTYKCVVRFRHNS